ncbi:antitoxin Xre-like helix-turn-helix domain-containing protein [Sodalis sp. RH21]|uniref:MbcA/ParS/Xre antitoxin family protein n=1 Tax=unclassified Sodalis (in: enterobacteria) TaxID=2636512 RepID=UPI0039B64877
MALAQKLRPEEDKKHQAAIGLKAVMAILDKWGATPDQAQAILQISKASFYKFKREPGAAQLSNDQLERLSYLLNIHAALRTLFENPENVYGFMGLNNHNPFFNGHAPLELISSGHFGTLYEVYKHIDALRGGQW